jgi:hypothetical protein
MVHNFIPRIPAPPVSESMEVGLQANPWTSSQSSVSILFMLRVFNDETIQLGLRLLQKVCSPQHSVFVHIDIKAKGYQCQACTPELFKRQMLCDCFAHVHIEQLHSLNWGKVNELYPLIDALRRAHSQKWDFDYFFPVSGQDFPLISVQKIGEVFQNSQYPNMSWFGRYKHLHRGNKLLWQNNKSPLVRCADGQCTKMIGTPGGNPLYKGTPNFYLSEVASHALVHYDRHLIRWLDFFSSQWKFAHSEHAFLTILLNHPVASVRQNIVHANYKDGDVPIRWEMFPHPVPPQGVPDPDNFVPADVMEHGHCSYPELQVTQEELFSHQGTSTTQLMGFNFDAFLCFFSTY